MIKMKKKKIEAHIINIATIFASTFLKKLRIIIYFTNMSQQVVVLLLGSNLGDKKKNILDALRMIEEEIGIILYKTDFLETFPIDLVSNNNFINFAIELKTVLSPIFVLNAIKSIEKKLGRLEDSKALGGYCDRVIDIDIVSYNHLQMQSEKLVIPHQEHLKREFSIKLLEELNEIKHKV